MNQPDQPESAAAAAAAIVVVASERASESMLPAQLYPWQNKVKGKAHATVSFELKKTSVTLQLTLDSLDTHTHTIRSYCKLNKL